MLVNAARGGASLVSGTEEWASPRGPLFTAAVDRTNEALASHPNNRFVGTFWIHGESDASFNVSAGAYARSLDSLITGFRAEINGGANTPFVVGSTVPDYSAQWGFDDPSFTFAQIAEVHRHTPTRVPFTSFVLGGSGNVGAGGQPALHYSAANSRKMGVDMANFGLRAARRQALPAAVPDTTELPYVWDAPRADSDSSSFTVRWGKPVVGAVTGYVVLYSSLGAPSPTTRNFPPGTYSATVSVSPGTYTVSLLAITSNAGTIRAAPLLIEVGGPLPPAPLNVTATATISTSTAPLINLSWAAAFRALSYTISYRINGSRSDFSTVEAINTNSFRLGDLPYLLSSDTAYELSLSSVNSVGTSAAVTVVRRTLPAGATPVVQGLAASAPPDSPSLSLSWSGCTHGPRSFVVQYRRVGTAAWTTVAFMTGNPVRGYTITGLSVGTAYNIQMAGANSLGRGAWAQLNVSTTPAMLGGDLLAVAAGASPVILAIGMRRLVLGYDGPLARVYAPNGAFSDVYAAPGGSYIDAAAIGVFLAGNGDGVASVEQYDQATGVRLSAPSPGARPKYSSVGINGRPMPLYLGIESQALPSGSPLALGTAHTLCVVSAEASATNSGARIHFGDGSATGYVGVVQNRYQYASGDNRIAGVPAADVPVPIGVLRQYQWARSGASLVFHYDSSSIVPSSLSVGTDALDGIRTVGGWDQKFARGFLPELIVVNASLSAAQLSAYQASVRAAYGVA